jgi:hypothetical protein
MNSKAFDSPEDGAKTSPEPFSAAWWHNRSGEELRAIMNRGLGVGAPFEGATAEADRRAREALAAEKAARIQAARNEQVRRVILEAILLASLLILLAEILNR